MTYQIVRIAPVYCAITDGLIGSKVVSRSHAYETSALAHKIAGRLWEENYEGCGDDAFYVVPFGGDAYRDRHVEPKAVEAEATYRASLDCPDDDYIPF